MKCPPALETEPERLRALAAYGLASDRPLPSLSPVVNIAVRVFDMPISAVNMIGSDHVFFAASAGIGDVDMSRDVSFCAHAITQNGVMVVLDATRDVRFHDNPLVTGKTHLRFYAGVPIRSPDGHALGSLCIIDVKPHPDFTSEDCERLRELAKMASDRLELRRVEAAVEKADPLASEEFVNNAATPIVRFDETGPILAWSAAAAAMYGYTVEEGVGRSIEQLICARHRPLVRDLIARAAAAGSLDGLTPPSDLEGLRKDESEFPLTFSIYCWNEAPRMRFSVVLRDLTQRRREEEELYRLANFDSLTGLANRARLYRRVEETLLAPAAAALLMIDLDGFKDVNDTLGHAVGDGILREVASRLGADLGMYDVVARIGGDEFAILLPGADLERANAVAQAAITRIAAPIAFDGQEVRVAASCGIALAPFHAQEALELIGDADLALYKAKSAGRGRAFVFVPALRMEAAARRLYAMELHRAVVGSEFLLFYQPQVRLADQTLVGAEALIRWHHPTRGILAPGAFLPALEGGPLAATVGSWVLDEACAQAAFWRRHGVPKFRIAVNLFAAQFRVGDLVAEVVAALERHGLPAEALELEVTENIALDRDEIALETLRRLRAHGVGIAFDDFGTGFGSLSLLKQYPLTRLKIDRSFVQGMLTSKRDAAVVQAVLDMARNFDLAAIAEGIETLAQSEYLQARGCEEAQGYYYGKPMPAQQFEEAFGIAPGPLYPPSLSRGRRSAGQDRRPRYPATIR